MEHPYIKKVLLVYLKFKFNWAPYILSANPNFKVLLGWQRLFFRENTGLLIGIGEHGGERLYLNYAVRAEFLFSSPSCIFFHQYTLERFGWASHLMDFIIYQMIPLNFM